jgi:hypothetical protein
MASGDVALPVPKSTVDVLRLRGRLHERADVAHDGELARSEERRELGAARVEPECRSNARRLDRQERRLRDLQARGGGARRRVLRIARGVHGNDGVVAVVAAVQEHAHERLVVARGLRGRVRHDRQHGQRARALQEVSSVHGHLCTW